MKNPLIGEEEERVCKGGGGKVGEGGKGGGYLSLSLLKGRSGFVVGVCGGFFISFLFVACIWGGGGDGGRKMLT